MSNEQIKIEEETDQEALELEEKLRTAIKAGQVATTTKQAEGW